jgi:hypothetical protein
MSQCRQTADSAVLTRIHDLSNLFPSPCHPGFIPATLARHELQIWEGRMKHFEALGGGLSAVLCWMLLSLSPALAMNADWQVYKNHEHQFTIDYPAGLFTQRGPAEGGDGVTFTSPNDSLVLSIYGFQNGDELPIKTVRDIIVENYSDRDITYQRLKDDWFVLSGYEMINNQRMIFYHRIAGNSDGTRFAVFEFTWPEKDRQAIDPLITRMSRSLTSPAAR